MKSGIDWHTLVGVVGTGGTVIVAHWSDIGAGFAGMGTGCYMLARAWHVWTKSRKEKALPLCQNFSPTKTGTEK